VAAARAEARRAWSACLRLQRLIRRTRARVHRRTRLQRQHRVYSRWTELIRRLQALRQAEAVFKCACKMQVPVRPTLLSPCRGNMRSENQAHVHPGIRTLHVA